LTGLPNRESLNCHLEEEVNKVHDGEITGAILSLVYNTSYAK